MKQKNVCLLSLLASFMLLIFAGSAFADTEVTFEDQTVGHDCQNVILPVNVTTDEAIKAFDMVAELIAGTANATVNSVTVHTPCGSYVGSDVQGAEFRFYGIDLDACCDVIPAGTSLLAEIDVNIGHPLGTFTICDTEWLLVDDPIVAEPNFVDGTGASTALTINCGTYTVVNTAPYFTNCPATITHGCDEGNICFDFDATDDDCAFVLTYGLESGTGGSINSGTGNWCIDVSQMCGSYNYAVYVEDEYGEHVVCNFVLTVTTEAPYFTDCPTDESVTSILWGYEASGSVNATDDDGCPFPLVYTLVGITGPGAFPGTFNYDTGNGDWSWQTEEDPAYHGTWTVYIEASDGCKADTCDFDIVVLPTYRVWIEKLHDVYQGHYAYVSVFLSDTTDYIGGYDFLIYYDASALTFMEAALGDELGMDPGDCEWEYFTYRFGAFGNCGGSCPSGLLRIVGMAEMNDGFHHPVADCAAGPLELAKLKFYVINDRTYECMYVPIGFFWFDCGDNGISGVEGDTLWVSRYVYHYVGPGFIEITGTPWVGGWQGIPGGVDCTEPLEGKPPALMGVDFWDGGIDIVCSDSIDARGDLNLNNIDHEIADAVLFTNYFIYGLGVFDINPEGQVAASDVNADGRVLTVGDLVYLTRVIEGDALPYPKLTPFSTTAEVAIENSASGVKISSSSAVDVGAAHFVFSIDGTVGDITPLVSGMDVKSDVVDGELRVLVYDIGKGRIPAGTVDLFSVEVSGNITIAETSFADYYGNDMNTNTVMSIRPTQFALLQNYPNPFNPSTEITIDIPGASDWKLDIFNVTGQLVESFSGYTDGLPVKVTWNANNVASGIYFYKATAGSYSAVKKMVLMK